MVYHYTNFVIETNGWWLRRVRPVWMGAVGIFLAGAFYRYYFFGKIQAMWHRHTPEEQLQLRAHQNKRDWGYDATYKPTIARSRKRIILETLGDKYVPASAYPERWMIETRKPEEVEAEENAWE